MPAVHQPPSPDNSNRPPPGRSQASWPWILLIGATGLLYGLELGSLELWAPDEPRYAAVAEEMRSFRHGPSGLILLHLNDVPYTQKPPLYFWLAALLGAPSGHVSALAARLPSAIAGVIGVALTAWMGRFLLGRTLPALLAAGILATSFRYVFTARRAQLDVLLTCCELLAIALFVALETRPGGVRAARQSPLIIGGIHAALGAAALIKGPVGWLPLAVFAAYLLWEKRGRDFAQLFPWWSWLLSVGPVLVWAYAAIALAPPGFAEEAVFDNVLGRFFSGTSHSRPFYYYLYQLPLNFLPWTLVLPFGLAVAWQRASLRTQSAKKTSSSGVAGRFGDRAGARFLLVWVAIPFFFFSISAGKRAVYLLPIFPALALLCVLVLPRPSEAEADSPVATKSTSSRAPRRFSIAIASLALVELLIVLLALPRLDADKSLREVAARSAAQIDAGEAIGVYGLSPIEAALGYYEDCAVASLPTEDDLVDFLRTGSQVVLMRTRHFESLEDRLRLVEIDAFRSGDRRLSLARTPHGLAPRGTNGDRAKRNPMGQNARTDRF